MEDKLYHNLHGNNLNDVVMPDEVWAVGPGSIVVSALYADLRPPEYKEDVIQAAQMRAISCDPTAVLEIMTELCREQRIVKGRAAHRRAV